MPTYDATERFFREHARLTPAQKRAFRSAVHQFVRALASRRFPRGLRVKSVHGAPGVFEMRWAPDGRATFEYGPEARSGDVHIIWRRIGTHDIFREP
jgi:hypothetical protein